MMIPPFFPVTPAEAGAQGNRQDLATGKAVTPAMQSHGALGPRFRGDDNGGSGDDNGGSGDDKEKERG